MNILVCNNFVRNGGGVDMSVRLEVRVLRALGHHVRVFGVDNTVLDTSRGFAKARLLASCLYSLPAKQALLTVLSEDRYDVAHVHNTVPLLTGSVFDAFRKHQVVVVQHLDNFRAFCLNAYAYRRDQRCDLCVRTAFASCTRYRCYHGSVVESAALTLARLIDCAHGRSSGDGAHAYIANSGFTKRQYVQHGFADSRIWVLHNAADDIAALLDAGTAGAPALRKKITFVGALLREKGVYSVLDLAEVMPDWEVQLIGAGAEEADLRRSIAARHLRNTSVKGRLVAGAKARAWQDSFVTVVPSKCDETFGLVVAESYSLAIPVVSTGSGGMAEIIRDATGFIESFRDPLETAVLLRALWNDQARYAYMRRAARRLFEAEFAEREFAKRLALVQATILDRYRLRTGP